MAEKLNKQQIVSLATLAKLKLSDEEIDQYQQELNNILKYVQQLSEVDTSGLEPTYQVTGLHSVMRPDEVAPQVVAADALLSLAPQTEKSYIKVNRMI